MSTPVSYTKKSGQSGRIVRAITQQPILKCSSTVLAYFLVSKVIFCSRYSVENIYQGLEKHLNDREKDPPTLNVRSGIFMHAPPPNRLSQA